MPTSFDVYAIERDGQTGSLDRVLDALRARYKSQEDFSFRFSTFCLEVAHELGAYYRVNKRGEHIFDFTADMVTLCPADLSF